jgi:NAD+ synthase (glutamine-hydrolysing)
LDWFFTQYQRNVFKRIQSPPIIITSKSSFGYDIRESMLPIYSSKKELELKEKLLQMKAYQVR